MMSGVTGTFCSLKLVLSTLEIVASQNRVWHPANAALYAKMHYSSIEGCTGIYARSFTVMKCTLKTTAIKPGLLPNGMSLASLSLKT